MLLSLLVFFAFQQAAAQTGIARLRSIWNLADKGENERALQLAREYLQKEPFSVEALDLAGVLATRVGSFTEAREYLLRAVRIKPESARVLSNLGFAYLQEKNPTEAIRFLRAALLLDSTLHDAWSNLANAFALLGDTAAEAAAKGVGLNPGLGQSPCAALANSLRSGHQSSAQVVTFQKLSDPCSTELPLVLLPDFPAVLQFRGASIFSLKIKDTEPGVWIFWSTPSQDLSGSARLTRDSQLEISLPESGTLYLTASRSVEIENWSVR